MCCQHGIAKELLVYSLTYYNFSFTSLGKFLNVSTQRVLGILSCPFCK